MALELLSELVAGWAVDSENEKTKVRDLYLGGLLVVAGIV